METKFQNRDSLKQLFKYFDDGLTMVEVGSFHGSSALVWAQKFGKIYCVDPWDVIVLKDKPIITETFKTFRSRTQENVKIIPIQKTSIDAAKDFPDCSLDFVYIDALHDYEHVKEDILTWRPKVKVGCFIGGHDYGYPPLPGVKKAVDEVLGAPQFMDTEFSWLIKKDK